MQFINWGEETPEQKAIRARYEQEALYEQASRINRAKIAQAAGGSRLCSATDGVTVITGTLIPEEFEKFKVFLPWNGVDENGRDRYLSIISANEEEVLVNIEIKWDNSTQKWRFTLNDVTIAESSSLYSGWNITLEAPEAPFANPMQVRCGNLVKNNICSSITGFDGPSSQYYGNSLEVLVPGESEPTLYLGALFIGYPNPETGWSVDLNDFGYGFYPLGGTLAEFPYGSYEVDTGVTLILSKGNCQIA